MMSSAISTIRASVTNPIAARQQVLEEERKERERLAYMDSIGKLLALSPREFEEVIRSLFVGLGVLQDASVVGGSGDRGADIIGTNHSGEKIIIQCKRYAPGSRVGTPDIQRFIGAIHIHKAARGIFVATCSFSGPAEALAEEHHVGLADGERCVRLLQRLSEQQQQH
ncbi:hypothetical protein KDH_28900 [Dictyobacter sp. S3.2.2.5]|uniref:Restriction endonuclease type IV Mrr domain-containing protein n=1 Tax=Dictyobacter halimunensis TaxID=3026934 RepID=A0ABQ6FTA5_9CHLR|nr:hypothetical protein KDH_28900 [Dictyobacter sp. S3.2.2.5]